MKRVFLLLILFLVLSCSNNDSKSTDDNMTSDSDSTITVEEEVQNDQEKSDEPETSTDTENDIELVDDEPDSVETDDSDNVEESVEEWNEEDFSNVYHVGPGHPLPDPSSVPWESIQPSTIVFIHYREEPYRDKWVIAGQGTEENPIVVTGVPENGKLPVITGEDAKTRQELDFWNENRGVIKIGGSSHPSSDPRPSWIYVENLDIRSGRPTFNFTDDSGSTEEFSRNAACVYVENSLNLTIKGNEIHDCGNGIFIGSQSKDVTISGNHIYDNGIEGRYYEHNTYTEAEGIIYEYNYFGPLRAGCDGNNLKDRSSGTVIRYNWIEAGNRQLDLVETGNDNILNDPRYQETFVYGNILIEPENAGNSQIIHYGGDGNDGLGEAYYRKGTLYFYHNTVVATKSGNTTLINLSTNDVSTDIRNNILYAAENLAISSGRGIIELHSNWIKENYRTTFESQFSGTLNESGNITGAAPAFTDISGEDFTLGVGSSAINIGTALPAETAAFPVDSVYEKHQSISERIKDSSPDAGAFERN